MPVILILNVGQDPSLSETRSSLLRAAGYIVESVLSIKEAIGHFQAGDFDLVLLCHTIPQKDRDRLACLIRASGSRTPIVTVAGTSGQAKDIIVDATIESSPKKLLSGIKEILATASDALSGGKARKPSSADGKACHKTVLCIDDDTNLLAIRRRILEHAGYIVLTADGGSHGLRVFSTGAVDLVLLDYSMPMMNGAGVAALIRQTRSDIPIFLVSGCTSIPEEDLALFDRFIPKGAPPNILLLALEETFAGVRKPSQTISAESVQPMYARHAIN
jgi:CheY-like chemotaxis protein